MSLNRFRRSTLLDKHEAEVKRVEKVEGKVQKIIKKAAKKN